MVDPGTHYDAMEIDTPPRPTPPAFIANPSNLSSSNQADLDFDRSAFKPTEAFSLHTAAGDSRDPSSTAPDRASDNPSKLAVALVDDFDEPDSPVPAARRRRPSKQHRKHSDDEGEGGDDPSAVLSKINRLGGKEFSFQVHHHHAAGAGPVEGQHGTVREEAKRWLHSGTPYVLLG